MRAPGGQAQDAPRPRCNAGVHMNTKLYMAPSKRLWMRPSDRMAGSALAAARPPPPRVHLNKRAVDPRVSIGVRERGRRLRVTQVARTAPTNFPTGLERREPVGVLQPAVPRPARPAVTGRLARKCPLASASARVLLNGAPTAGHSFQTRSSR